MVTAESYGDGLPPDDWRAGLERSIARGVAEVGSDEVRSALTEQLQQLAPTTPTPLLVDVPVLGVDACPTGWVGVLLAPGARPAALSSRSIGSLVELARESAQLAVVAVDIPIGLPDDGVRAADVLARRALGARGSSVFATLTRPAYAATTYADARTANLEATAGVRSASAQAYGLRAKVLDVDAWVRARPGVVVIEAHPELCFARMAGAPVAVRKKDPEGVRLRRALLERAGLTPPAWFRGSGFGEDDLLDACAVAWTAVRHSRGEAESMPVEPEVFGDGLAAAIWV